MSYLAELRAERKQRLVRLGAMPDKGSHLQLPVPADESPAETERAWLEGMPLSEQSRAALSAADRDVLCLGAISGSHRRISRRRREAFDLRAAQWRDPRAHWVLGCSRQRMCYDARAAGLPGRLRRDKT